VRVYFLYTVMKSFVRKDLDILQTAHEVKAECNYRKGIRNLWRNLKGVVWADLVFCWFGSLHFFPSVIMAKLLGRKIIIVAGGYDVVNLPEIDYGNMRGGFKTALVRFMYKLAGRIISISESNRRETIENAKVAPSKVTLIYHGFAAVDEPTGMKERMVVTIGEVTWSNLKRKGLEDFVRVARYFPDVAFKSIGKWTDDSHVFLRDVAPGNVEITGFIPDSTVSEILSRAKVYVQASKHEGFGCSVAEAMLYNCIPVVNDVPALSEIVGNTGFRAKPGDIGNLKEQIDRALNSDDSSGEKARNRILDKFPLSKRAGALLDVVAHAQ
jgi:glycosyltransferase involved in cell wall biosynthesis